MLEGRTVVFVRSGDKFEARNVELGGRDGERVEVIFGLLAGEVYAAKNSFNRQGRNRSSLNARKCSPLNEDRAENRPAHFQRFIHRHGKAVPPRSLIVDPLPEVLIGAKERDGQTARGRRAGVIREVVPNGRSARHVLRSAFPSEAVSKHTGEPQ